MGFRPTVMREARILYSQSDQFAHDRMLVENSRQQEGSGFTSGVSGPRFQDSLAEASALSKMLPVGCADPGNRPCSRRSDLSGFRSRYCK